ncbi:MAG TPA: hypothetical protein VFU47_01825 [Armatimonadota bacterium]|nr:hypothetical protein [Armatimonadota bacterium]
MANTDDFRTAVLNAVTAKPGSLSDEIRDLVNIQFPDTSLETVELMLGHLAAGDEISEFDCGADPIYFPAR